MKANVLSISDERLEVTGMYVGTIAQQTVVNVGGTDEADIIQFIRDSAPPGILSSAHPANVPMIEAFCCKLCFDVFWGRTVQGHVVFPSFAYSLKFLESILAPDSDASDLNAIETKPYLRYVADACKGRSIIETRSGHIRLAPSICELRIAFTYFLAAANSWPSENMAQIRSSGLSAIHMSTAWLMMNRYLDHFRTTMM